MSAASDFRLEVVDRQAFGWAFKIYGPGDELLRSESSFADEASARLAGDEAVRLGVYVERPRRLRSISNLTKLRSRFGLSDEERSRLGLYAPTIEKQLVEAARREIQEVHTASRAGVASGSARKWTDKVCMIAAEKYLNLDASESVSERCRKATGLKNATDVRPYVKRGLELLCDDPEFSGRARAALDNPKMK